MEKTPESFIFMKVGNHAGETFEQILQRKNQEKKNAGKIFWGYGGPTLHPLSQVQPFARAEKSQSGIIYILMETIESNADPDILPATHYSADGINWEEIPEGVDVLGSRYALIMDEIKPVDISFHPEEFIIAIGPSREKIASEYLRGHVDKACLTIAGSAPQATGDIKVREARYAAELLEPYAVLLKHDP